MPQPIECFLTLINITVDCPSKLVVTDASQIEYSGTKPALIKSTLPTRPCPFVTTSLEGRCFGWGYRSFPVIAGFWHLVANMVYSSLLCPNETRYSSFVESCWWHVALKHFCLAVYERYFTLFSGGKPLQHALDIKSHPYFSRELQHPDRSSVHNGPLLHQKCNWMSYTYINTATT